LSGVTCLVDVLVDAIYIHRGPDKTVDNNSVQSPLTIAHQI